MTTLGKRFIDFRAQLEASVTSAVKAGVGVHRACDGNHVALAPQFTFLDSEGRRGSAGGFPSDMDPSVFELFSMLCRYAYQPEWVIFHSDGFAPVVPINPTTRRPWALEEVYEEGNKEGSAHRGLVTDAILVEMIDCKTKKHFQRAMPYMVSPDDGIVFREPIIFPFPTVAFISGFTQPFPEDMPLQNLQEIEFDAPDEVKLALRSKTVFEYFEKVLRIASFEMSPRDSDHPDFARVLHPYYGRLDVIGDGS